MGFYRSSNYLKKIIQYSMRGVVLEDNIWYFGEPKEMAKVNVPMLFPEQEPAEIVKYIKKKTNRHIADEAAPEALNYIEIYLPDNMYTFPTDGDVVNPHPKIKGAKKTNPKRTKNNGETKEGLIRIVKKNTEIMLFFLNGIPTYDNIKVLGRYDDFDKEAEMQTSNFGNRTSASAKASGTRYGSAKGK